MSEKTKINKHEMLYALIRCTEDSFNSNSINLRMVNRWWLRVESCCMNERLALS